ncbi:MAG: helix-turn-helix domain-containing protein [Anaerolineae bacterium]
MADQLVNYTAIRSRTTRTGRSEWLQAWLDGETPDQHPRTAGLSAPHLFYAVVIYRQSNENVEWRSVRRCAAYGSDPSRCRRTSDVVWQYGCLVPPRQTHSKQPSKPLKPKIATVTEPLELSIARRGRPRHRITLHHNRCGKINAAHRRGIAQRPRATFFGNSSLYGLLLSNTSRAELHHFCMTWLAELISYDNQQNSDLLDTLRTYFSNNGNTALTAKELRIHRNTLAYRLNRIAEITCLDLDDADVRLNLHLALKAREVLGLGGSAGNLQ